MFSALFFDLQLASAEMLRFGVLLALAVCAYGAPTKEGPRVPMLDGRIVGGQAVSIVNFPYQLSLVFGNSHICGASILSSNWALTAAHCTVGLAVGNLRLRSGSSTINTGGTLSQISRVINHASYNPNTIDFDIALAQIGGSFPFGSGVATIGLPAAGSTPAAGLNAVVSGWGATSEGGSAATTLQAVTLPIISQAQCRSIFGTSAITDRMICAGFLAGGRDACQGDSGGPLVIGNTLVGVVSWGVGCARPNSPGVYASTGNLRNWISANSGV